MSNACPGGAALGLALLLVAAPAVAQPGSMTPEAGRAFLRRLQPSPIEELRLERLIGDLGAERFVERRRLPSAGRRHHSRSARRREASFVDFRDSASSRTHMAVSG